MSETVVVHTSDGDLPVLRFTPSSPNGAGVVVVQEIFGVSGYIQDRCQDLADVGYLVYAPDLYDRLSEKAVIDPESAGAWQDFLSVVATDAILEWPGIKEVTAQELRAAFPAGKAAERD